MQPSYTGYPTENSPSTGRHPLGLALWWGVAGAVVIGALSAFGFGTSLWCVTPLVGMGAITIAILGARTQGNRAGQGAVGGILVGFLLICGLFVGTFIYTLTDNYAADVQHAQATATVSAAQTATVATSTPSTATTSEVVSFSSITTPAIGDYFADGFCGLGLLLLLPAIGGKIMGSRPAMAGAYAGAMAPATPTPSSPATQFPIPFAQSSAFDYSSALPGPQLFAAGAETQAYLCAKPFHAASQEGIPDPSRFGDSESHSILMGIVSAVVVGFMLVIHFYIGALFWGAILFISGLIEGLRLRRFLSQSELTTGFITSTFTIAGSLFVVVTFVTNLGQTMQLSVRSRYQHANAIPVRYRNGTPPEATVMSSNAAWANVVVGLLVGGVALSGGIWLLAETFALFPIPR